MAVVSANDIWAVDFSVNGSSTHSLTEHWDGSSWSIVPIPRGPVPPNISNTALWGVVVVAANDVWTVGDDSMTLAEHYNDLCSTTTVTPTFSPTAAPTPTNIATNMATNTPAPPTNTPTNTAVPPTNTPISPNQTPGGATATPIPTSTPTGTVPSTGLLQSRPGRKEIAPLQSRFLCRGVIYHAQGSDFATALVPSTSTPASPTSTAVQPTQTLVQYRQT